MDLSHNLINYFRECLSKESFEQSLTDVFSGSHTDHLVSSGFSRPDYGSWPEVGKCTLEDLGLYRNKYDGVRRWARNDNKENGPLMMGVYPVVISGMGGEEVRAPLLVASLDNVLSRYGRFAKNAQEPFDFGLLRYNSEVVRALGIDLPALNWQTGSNVLDFVEACLETRLGKDAVSLWGSAQWKSGNRVTDSFSSRLDFQNTWLNAEDSRGWLQGIVFWLPNGTQGEPAIRNWKTAYGYNASIHEVSKVPRRWDTYECLTWGQLGLEHGDLGQLASLQLLKGQDYQLMLGLYPIAASITDEEGKVQRIRAPLLHMPFELEDKRAAGVRALLYSSPISVERLEYNPILLELFDEPLPELDFSDGLAPLGRIEEFLQRKLSSPQIEKEHWCSRGIRSKQWRSGKILWGKLPFCWFSRRSRLERSVMHELSLMAESDHPLSPPLLQILGNEQPQAHQGTSTADRLPSPLTKAQESTLANGAVELLSVINGPPGTGKTHTLACQAFDRVINGESVLVVCANDHAADVVRDKVTALFGSASGLVVRPGRGGYRKEFLEKLEKWLSRGERQSSPLKADAVSEPLDHRLQIARKRFTDALAKAEEAARKGDGIRAWWRRWWVARDGLLSSYWQDLMYQLGIHQEASQRFMKATLRARLSELLQDHRRELSELVKAVRSRSSYRRSRHLESIDWHLMTRVLPVWIVSASELNESVPLVQGLFDLVVVDEATQCNLALALPALQRGRRAVVVGDPQQLRHFSFVSRDWQRKAAIEHEVEGAGIDLDYRARSLLDYAMSAVQRQDAVVFLDEHFRSHPDLIRFSNERYYDNRIQVLTHHKSELVEQAYRHIDCGLELEDKLNLSEMDAVIRELKRLIAVYTEADVFPSIGVLAMQRRAAIELEKRIVAEVLLKDISRFSLRVATPFGFQGEERDIVLMATCLWPGQSEPARRFMNRDDVLNVAITRARHQQILFYPKPVLTEPGDSPIQAYLCHARNVEQMRMPVQSEPVDVVRRELQAWLGSRGVECRSDYQFAGQCIDLVAFFDSHRVAIDIVGGELQDETSLAWAPDRYRLLERAGMRLYPLAAVHWHKRQDDVKAELMGCLGLDREAVAPISVPSLDSDLYQRLLGLPVLGEWDDGNDASLTHLYKELAKSNKLAGFWIQQHFKPTELSFQRYDTSRHMLYTAAVTELSGLCLLIESLKDMDGLDLLALEIQRRYQGCRDAVAVLTQLAGQLAVLKNNSQLDQALADVNRLTEQVVLYERE